PLKDLERRVAGYRYVPYGRIQGNWVRDLVVREANAEFVLCVDSHVLFPPGTLARLVAYLETHPGASDLLQGPLIGDDLKPVGTAPRSGSRGCRACGPQPGAAGPATPPRSRSRCRASASSPAAKTRGPATIRDCADSAWRKATFTRRSGGPAAGRCACRFSA